MEELTHFSLFSGIGGFDLAAEWAGFRSIGLVEKNPYRQRVLRKYWSDVPLWEDIRDVTEDSLKEAGILADTQLDGWIESREGRRSRGLEKEKGEKGKAGNKPPQAPQHSSQDESGETNKGAIPPVTLVTGGFPCQSFSVAGKRRGKADDRYLWPEMFRVIRLIRPHWVVGENVDGIVRMALDTVLSDLEGEGYSARAFIIPACGANAPHRRYRVWIVASLSNIIQRGSEHKDMERRQARVETGGGGSDVPDTKFTEIRNGETSGGTSNERRRPPETRGEAVCTGEEAPQPSYLGQGGEALAHAIDNKCGASGRTDDRNRQEDNKGGQGRSQPRAGRCGETLVHAEGGGPGEQEARNRRKGSEGGGQEERDAPHTEKQPERKPTDQGNTIAGSRETWQEPSSGNWWEFEPDVGRVADGVPHRVDRLAALGDAIVPRVAYQILKAIADIERTIQNTPKC